LSDTFQLPICAERKKLSILWQQHLSLLMGFSNSAQILLLYSEMRTGMAGFDFRQVKEICLFPEWTRHALGLTDRSVVLVPELFACDINDRSLNLII
jgi:hypothetical protein